MTINKKKNQITFKQEIDRLLMKLYAFSFADEKNI